MSCHVMYCMDGCMHAYMYECAYGMVWSRVCDMLWYGMVCMYVCSIHGNPGRLDAAQHPWLQMPGPSGSQPHWHRHRLGNFKGLLVCLQSLF